MSEWWEQLSALNQGLFSAASFFSVIFIWQFIAAFIGLGGDDVDADVDVDADLGHAGTYDHFEHGAGADAVESTMAFKLLSIRTIITFFTLFTWGGALYMNQGASAARALLYGTLWGLAGMLIVALLFFLMKKMAYTGTKKLLSCIGTTGVVYLDIQEAGVGEVRVTVSNVVSYVKAREKDGRGLKANTPIKVVRLLGQTMVEVVEDNG